MKKKLLIVTLCALCLLLVAGCSSSEKATVYDVAAEAPVAAMDTAPDAGEYNYGSDNSYNEDSYAEEPMVEEATAQSVGDLGDLPNVTMPETGRKLVYSASFALETKQFDEDYTTIKKALANVGGYVESENTYADSNEYGAARYASMTLRIPIASYNSFLDTLSGVGTVRDKQIGTEDISDNYFDTEARIDILEMRRDRLLGYLEEATKMDDIVSLEGELSDVLYELDQYKGSQRSMDGLVEFASAYVTLDEIISAETVTSDGDPLGERAANAYNLSLSGVGRFVQNFAIGFAAAAPVLILLAIIAVIVIAIVKLARFLRRRWIAKHGPKEKKQKPPYFPQNPMAGPQPPIPPQNGMPPQNR
ncbi:DUF4349 domain-containing protein [Christensenellaceae bacterium OttesenSCG-928-K19]|nr:DUF4349 domain-containing protein [Christensenellaceae bacterium OttesenSCG-928-K19]